MKIGSTGNIILVHKGALGDFMLCWPCFYSIRRAFPEDRIHWCGNREFLGWLEPMNISPLPRSMESLVSSLYHRQHWPEALSGHRIIWFGIRKKTVSCRDSRLVFINGVTGQGQAGFTETCMSRLEEKLCLPPLSWEYAWQGYFGKRKKPEHVLIFVGSGSLKKNWPLDRFIRLAELLNSMGLKIKFILGPVEREKKLIVSGFDKVYCDSYDLLQDLIRRSLLVAGNDCGPMHLAAMYNIPGVVLFGPTSPAIWKPRGMEVIQSSRTCCPCTEDGIISCPQPECLSDIQVEQVMSLIQEKINNPEYEHPLKMEQKNRLPCLGKPGSRLLQKEEET